MRETIYIIDDNADIVRIVTDLLSDEGYIVRSSTNPVEGLKNIQTNPPDLVLLDIRMEEMDGLDVCREIKAHANSKNTGVIMLSVKNQESDIVLGLGMGADDYISKPIREGELLARVKAVLRRKNPEPEREMIRQGPLFLDRSTYTAKIHDNPLSLTPKEFELLMYFSAHEGHVVTRSTLSEKIWGREHMTSSHTIEHHVYELRKKMGNAGKWIHALKGVGYRFEIE